MDVDPTELVTVGPENFIMPEQEQANYTKLVIECLEKPWVRSFDTSLGILYLCLSIMGISENGYLFYQMFSTLRYRTNQSKASFFTLVSNLAAGDIIILTVPVWATIHGLLNGRDILGSPGSPITGMSQ